MLKVVIGRLLSGRPARFTAGMPSDLMVMTQGGLDYSQVRNTAAYDTVPICHRPNQSMRVDSGSPTVARRQATSTDKYMPILER